MLTLCLGWTPVPHKQAAHRRPRTHTVRKPSLQVAGLQVHATTLSYSYADEMKSLSQLPNAGRVRLLRK